MSFRSIYQHPFQQHPLMFSKPQERRWSLRRASQGHGGIGRYVGAVLVLGGSAQLVSG